LRKKAGEIGASIFVGEWGALNEMKNASRYVRDNLECLKEMKID